VRAVTYLICKLELESGEQFGAPDSEKQIYQPTPGLWLPAESLYANFFVENGTPNPLKTK
jgi:hypothetical protein